MRVKRLRSRGAMMVIAIGMMVLVSMMTVNQLQTLKINMDGRSRVDQAKMAETAARSGIEYGYAMLKNLMDSMSLIHLRFATHYYGNGTNQMIADIPPSWQEIINIHFDRKAAASTIGVNFSNANVSTMGNWVGTDSYFTHFHENPEEDPAPSASLSADTGQSNAKPIDYSVAMEGANGDALNSILTASGALNSSDSYLRTTLTARSGYWALDSAFHQRLRECAREEVQYFGAGAARVGVLYPEAAYVNPTQINTQCHYIRIWGLLYGGIVPDFPTALGMAPGDPFTVVPQGPMTSYDGANNYYLDGHFGTKRWHYFDAFNFPAVSGVADPELSINAVRGTGGSISTTRSDFPLDNSPGLGTFLNFRDILFERLVNYRYDSTLSRYPYEPKDYSQSSEDLAEASPNSYNVQMFTTLDLDFERPVLGITEDEDLYNHTDYGNIRHKIFFKLWITRDEAKNGYAGEAFTAPVTWPPKNHPLDTGIQYRSYKGTVVDGPTSDLHPVWMVPRETGNISGYSGNVLVTESSYWKPNYLNDFLDTNRNSNTSDLLGVLQFPVPYLAVQRGDYDIFPTTVMGQHDKTNPPLVKDEYTKFTLWSLGTVKEISPDIYVNRSVPVGSDLLYPESQQRISDFKTVARVLYKMDFYVDIRAVDVHSQNNYIDYSQNLDGAETNSGSIIVTDGSCAGTPAKNRANQAYYNSRFIPICDVDNRSPSGSPARSRYKHFEPLGIIAHAVERVPYVDSRRP
ncbi:MAG: hypothetical protein H3C47_10380 [Candidatus Cloacimonetes bacterium]|nr:hypothetical protein [Candidatus Cloacimonadota bacterium]